MHQCGFRITVEIFHAVGNEEARRKEWKVRQRLSRPLLRFRLPVGLHDVGGVEGRVSVVLAHPGIHLILAGLLTGFWSSGELGRHFSGLQPTFAGSARLRVLWKPRVSGT